MFKYAIAALALTLSVTSNAATLLVDGNGQLTGATGVDVGGSFFDVMFRDGSCNSLFNGCTEFTFTSLDAALGASQALLDQVFIDDGAGRMFDSNPELTLGITFFALGEATTPYAFESTGRGTFAANVHPFGTDQVDKSALFTPSRDSGTSPRANAEVFAVWTPASPVPLPAAGWLFISALAGLVGTKRLSRR